MSIPLKLGVIGSRHECHFLSGNLVARFEIDKNGLTCENLGCQPIPGTFGKEAVDVSEYRAADS